MKRPQLPDRHHPFVRGRIDKQRAHALLTPEMRQRILDTLPISERQRHREQEHLDRIARWIERYTLAGAKADLFPSAEEQNRSIEAIDTAAMALARALVKADDETKKHMYEFLAKHGDALGTFKGDPFSRGRQRYERLLGLISLGRSAAKRSKKKQSAGQKGGALVELVEVLRDIWVEATGRQFKNKRDPKRDAPRQTDRPRIFVECVLEVAKEIAAQRGRKPLPPGPFGEAASLNHAMSQAVKVKGLRSQRRTPSVIDSDRNTYRKR